MVYEKELEYLRKEFNKSSAKFHLAEAEGYETDAEMWGDDMVNIGHQIHIHEQATKADEYEAKAESYTKLVSQISAIDAIVATNYDKDMTDTNLHLLMLGAEVKRFFESGEYDAKK